MAETYIQAGQAEDALSSILSGLGVKSKRRTPRVSDLQMPQMQMPGLPALSMPGVPTPPGLDSFLSMLGMGGMGGRSAPVPQTLMEGENQQALAAAGLLGSSSSAVPTSDGTSVGNVKRWQSMVESKAVANGVNDPLFTRIVLAAIGAESTGNPGAVGLEADGRRSGGLLQIHDIHGIDMALRQDPEFNLTWSMPRFAKTYKEAQSQGLKGDDLIRYTYYYANKPAGGMYGTPATRVTNWFRDVG